MAGGHWEQFGGAVPLAVRPWLSALGWMQATDAWQWTEVPVPWCTQAKELVVGDLCGSSVFGVTSVLGACKTLTWLRSSETFLLCSGTGECVSKPEYKKECRKISLA